MDNENSTSNKIWLYEGVGFGILMYIFNAILAPLIFGRGITSKELLIGILVWAVAGLVFGLMMKMVRRWRKKNLQE